MTISNMVFIYHDKNEWHVHFIVIIIIVVDVLVIISTTT